MVCVLPLEKLLLPLRN